MKSFKVAICSILLAACGPASAFSTRSSSIARTRVVLNQSPHDDDEEEARLQILTTRRKQIRAVLKSADALRESRIAALPRDADGNVLYTKKEEDTKTALTFTAFLVAAGAVALRVGGRAALVSAVGLDFMTESPELQQQLESILKTAETMDYTTKLLLFTAAWTAVKCLCLDAGGIVLALSSGILFGGVLQGAILSAAAATVGSSVAFGLAKLNTPVRQKALQLLEEYPSLRGIEKVVAKDGLKAVLTLRLAPILPIPLGLYNYVYGVTNVGWGPFCGGIFLGSLKPYLLDSYLGYFGKSIVDGSIQQDAGGMQDTLLLVALGVSVLIGVFASQLASETWDAVLQEVEEEKKKTSSSDKDDSIKREILGWKLPEWIIGFQIALQEADERVRSTVVSEYQAKVWNYTNAEDIPPSRNPALRPDSPEQLYANRGFDFTESFCDGLVLSPILLQSYLKYSDPRYNETEDLSKQSSSRIRAWRARLESIRHRAQERIRVLEEAPSRNR
ncbi:hypothetical protein FisN_18Hh072 [Fistulifera solaris]|uniref:VTT domain-containing protein n=1 Tax=Fistulifera solaris TaxID=1519565 RepID=A0A1Z5JVP7_FISSO|nr:hypothetical protein FisN_18Hh072 [Fistulifera solaris]|eukprot:GAX17868.1 hypothetical protein FisN_18Hh072 [Fistulifera solaris]